MAEEIFDIYIMVNETGAIIHASETDWCKVREQVPGREWLYCFEDMKEQPFPDLDYDEPVLHVEKLDGRLQVSVWQYGGEFHSDVFVFGRVIWRGVGGVEGIHVGDSVIVEFPEVPPPVPPPVVPPEVVPPEPGVPPVIPPAPPEWKPLTDPLDAMIEKLWDIKEEIRPIAIKANTYSVLPVDLATARVSFKEVPVGGFAMTIYKCTGSMEVKLGDLSTDGIPIDPMAYPQMIVIDRMDFPRFYIRNAAQAGLSATIIVWKRE